MWFLKGPATLGWRVPGSSRQKSQFQAVKMQKMSSDEAWYPWTVGFTTQHFQAAKMHKKSSHKATDPGTVGWHNWHKSHFQAAKMQKIRSHEARYPWRVGFTSRHKSHFQAAKTQKISSQETRCPEIWVSRLRRNRFFKPPKCRKWIHTKISNLEIGFHNAEDIEFHATKLQKRVHSKLGILEPLVSRMGRNRNFRQNAQNEFIHG